MSDYILEQWRCVCCGHMTPMAELVCRADNRYICRRCVYYGA